MSSGMMARVVSIGALTAKGKLSESRLANAEGISSWERVGLASPGPWATLCNLKARPGVVKFVCEFLVETPLVELTSLAFVLFKLHLIGREKGNWNTYEGNWIKNGGESNANPDSS